MRTIVVSGFGPWGAIDENPTERVLECLRADADPGVVTLALPVDSAALDRAVGQALETHKPDLWVGLGLAMGAAVVAVERLAVNLRDFAEPDIAGARLRDTAIVEGGPAAYRATWPVRDIVRALHAGGIPARASNSAGAFLCNQLMYAVLHGIATRRLATRAGFLHVPAHPALIARQSGRAAEHPSMALGTMVDAVRIAIAAANLVPTGTPLATAP